MDAGRLSRTALAVALALAAAAVVWFWLVRDPPPEYSCGETPPPGHEARRDDFRSGSIVWHAAVCLATLVALVAQSRERMARRGRGGIGKPTLAAVLVVVLLALSTLVELPAGWALVFLPAVALGLLAEPLGAAATAVAGAAGLVALAIAAAGRRTAWMTVTGWTLLLLAPGHAFLVEIQGEGPWFC